MLIVEARQARRRTLHDLLAAVFPETRILLADSGASALATCGAERPQVVLLDSGLPDADGIELTEQLRTYSPAPAVIVISDLGRPEDAVRARAAGACAFIARDQLATALVPAVARALGITRLDRPKKP